MFGNLSKQVLRSTLASAAILSAVLMMPVQAQPPAATQNAPINAGGVAVVDIPSSSAQTVQLDIEKGRFAQESVDHLLLTAKNIDFKAGSLGALTANIQNALFDTMPVEQLQLAAPGFTFNTVELMTNRRFVLDKPVNANVNLRITEKNLNSFFSNPKTIEKLESSVARKTGNIKLITFSNPAVKLQNNNHIHLLLTVNLLGGENGTAAAASPMDFEGDLVIRDHKLAIENLTGTSNQVQLPVDISAVLQKKFNEMIDFQRLGKKSFVIVANNMKISKNAIEIGGQASLTRLEFGG